MHSVGILKMFNAEHPVLMSSFSSGRTLVVPLLLLGFPETNAEKLV